MTLKDIEKTVARIADLAAVKFPDHEELHAAQDRLLIDVLQHFAECHHTGAIHRQMAVEALKVIEIKFPRQYS